MLYFIFVFCLFGIVIGQNEFGDGFTQLCNERLIAGHAARDCQGCDMLRSTAIAIIRSAVYSSNNFMSRGYVTSWYMVGGKEGDSMAKPSREMLNYL